METLKTVADLKRAVRVGRRLHCIVTKGASVAMTPERRKEWENRAVTHVDTTGFYLKADEPMNTTTSKRGSCCTWPRAAEFTGGVGTFTITTDAGQPIEMIRVYTFID